MLEFSSATARPGQTLVFSSGRPRFFVAGVVIAFFAAVMVLAPRSSNSSPPSSGAVVAFLFFAGIFLAGLSRRWTAEIDLSNRTLEISRRLLGRWTTTIVNCPLDQWRG